MSSKLSSLLSKVVDTDGSRVFGLRTDLVERFVDVFRRDRKAQFGFGLVCLFGVMAIVAPELAPYDPMAQRFSVLAPPSLGPHPAGTDSYGRDLLSRLMVGARISLSIGLFAVAIGAVGGIVLGLVAGFVGGRVDDVLMRIVDVLWAFPYLLIALILVAIAGRGYWNVVFALGFAYIDDFARIVRGEVLAIREEEYVLAAKAVGLSSPAIMIGEVLPNTVAPLIVQFTVLVARAMLGEATLSFLGLGVQPTTPSWGALLGQGRNLVTTAPWVSVLPGLLIMVTVLGINLFGDALRDAFDVRETQ